MGLAEITEKSTKINRRSNPEVKNQEVKAKQKQENLRKLNLEQLDAEDHTN